MAAALIKSAPFALELISQGLNFCSTILQYRQATMQIELERESMHRQADLAMLEEKNKHEIQMQKIKQLAKNYKLAVQQNRKNIMDINDCYKEVNNHINKMTNGLLNLQLTPEERKSMLDIIQILQTQCVQLSQQHFELANQTMTAYIHSCDQLRDTPNTFTDVS